MDFIEIIKSIFLGIVEGITEWLPISSTGHMILFNEFLGNKESFTNSDLYLYVIQLGAILAVVTLFFHKLNPFSPKKTSVEKKDTWQMWFKVVTACVPTGIAGLLLEKYMDKLEIWQVVSAMLIIYGIIFILIEKFEKKTSITTMNQMTYKTAFLIGTLQILSIVPGTSRSGATILGAMILGCSREIAAEFTFFLAIPIMFGVSFIKIITVETLPTTAEIITLAVGMVVSYLVSLVSIKFLMNYVRKHDFKVFGIYRIALGIIVISYFLIAG